MMKIDCKKLCELVLSSDHTWLWPEISDEGQPRLGMGSGRLLRGGVRL